VRQGPTKHFTTARRQTDDTIEIPHPDNSALHMGKICSFPLHISRVVLLLLRQRRGRGNDLGTTIKNLRKTTSGAAGIGLGATIKYPRRTTGAAAGNGLGTKPN
jgi:hypothetical protein